MTAVDPITTRSTLLASPAAPKTAMSALELDGYLTGVIVTPQAVPIQPSAWIGRLWGDDDPIFADEAQINAALGAVALRYNTLIRDIDRNLERLEAERIVDHRPLFVAGDQKPSHDAVCAWARGFWRAMALAPATWSKLGEDERTKIIVEPFAGFFRYRRRRSKRHPRRRQRFARRRGRPDPPNDPHPAQARPHPRSCRASGTAPLPGENRAQRSMPLRLRKETQTLLRSRLAARCRLTAR